MRERLPVDPAHHADAPGASAPPAADLVDGAARLLDRLREHAPLTQCITNSVVTGFTANVLLALGGSPAMVDLVGEAGPFAAIAGGLLVNLGTPIPEQRDAAREAVVAATAAGTPWVLDPVAIGALPVRTALAHELLAAAPAAIRGNASEVLALAGASGGGRGVDSVDTADGIAPEAIRLAAASGAVVAVSGPVDLITDGVRVARVANGTALLTRVTGGGCALGAVTAAFLAAARGTGHDRFTATVAATLVYTVAAERAAVGASGPGDFAVRLLDALAAVSGDDIRAEARVTAALTADGVRA